MSAKDVLLGKMLGSAAKLSDQQVAETAELLLRHAAKNNASDVHIEPHERWGLVRYRVAGELGGVYKLPLGALPALGAKIKAAAGLPAESHGLPQNGSYQTEVGGINYTVTVATMPVVGGEKTVLHLTQKTQHAPSLESLGFWGEGLALLRTILRQPRGLLLVASPMRGGKSTTLRSLLALLNRPTVSIASIENRVEHRLPGVAQTGIESTHTTFASSLQAVLQQDPNIIMLEQLPDSATAKLAAQAAAGGHLVLAGLHADDALHALLQVEAMGVEPFVLGHALQGVVSQQLVRKLCGRCRERYALSRDEQTLIAKTFGITSVAAFKRVHDLERQALEAKLNTDGRANTTHAAITHLWRANPDGCAACGHSGYDGQVGVVEILGNGAQLQKAFLAPDASAKTVGALHSAALKDGFVPLLLDGFIKALCGQTTVEQLVPQLTQTS